MCQSATGNYYRQFSNLCIVVVGIQQSSLVLWDFFELPFRSYILAWHNQNARQPVPGSIHQEHEQPAALLCEM